MRPVEKVPVGSQIVLSDGTAHIVQADYNPYQDAKSALIANLGCICSYCEDAYHQPRDLQVEHVQPKGLLQYASLKTKWENFLLSCATCNGPDNKDTKDVNLSDVHLPFKNNTFKSLKYMAGGVVVVNPTLQGLAYNHADALLRLVGLDKSPASSCNGDTRWQKRRIDWRLANRYLQRFQAGEVDEDVIIDLVQNRGGWSIWFTVFAGCDSVRSRLISDFPGTCSACFDANNHYEPVDRNSGQSDPV